MCSKLSALSSPSSRSTYINKATEESIGVSVVLGKGAGIKADETMTKLGQSDLNLFQDSIPLSVEAVMLFSKGCHHTVPSAGSMLITQERWSLPGKQSQGCLSFKISAIEMENVLLITQTSYEIFTHSIYEC